MTGVICRDCLGGDRDCRTCWGAGYVELCEACDGEGWVEHGACTTCGGTFSKTCAECGGTGYARDRDAIHEDAKRLSPKGGSPGRSEAKASPNA